MNTGIQNRVDKQSASQYSVDTELLQLDADCLGARGASGSREKADTLAFFRQVKSTEGERLLPTKDNVDGLSFCSDKIYRVPQGNTGCKTIKEALSSKGDSLLDTFSDKVHFELLYKEVSSYKEKLLAGEESKSKAEDLHLCVSVINCLHAYERGEIPAKFPDFSAIPEPSKCGDELLRIKTLFFLISSVRSCISLDEKFVNELSSFIHSGKAIEIYAGNGWLTHELNKRSVKIEASDRYVMTDRYGIKREYGKCVSERNAEDAASDFVDVLSGDDRGFIIVGFPEGMIIDLMNVFRTISKHPNCSIIAIGLIEKEWDYQDWDVSSSLVKTDITEFLKYTPSTVGERVVIYSRKAGLETQ